MLRPSAHRYLLGLAPLVQAWRVWETPLLVFLEVHAFPI